jgi:hypothetical protein
VRKTLFADPRDVAIQQREAARWYPRAWVSFSAAGNRGVAPDYVAAVGVIVDRWAERAGIDDPGAVRREIGTANRTVDTRSGGDIVELADGVLER